jgi:hypothetical protein
MHPNTVFAAVALLVVLTLGGLRDAGAPQSAPASSAPSLEGTYRLFSRTLPDGTRQSPPNIIGLMPYP